MGKDQGVIAGVFRKIGRSGANVTALAFAGALAIGIAAPSAAQLYSKGYLFLEAVDKREGDTVTEMLNDPGAGRTLINSRDVTSGDTALHTVVKRRDTLWVKFLLQKQADPNVQNKAGTTPLQLATQMGFVDGVEELIKRGAQVDVPDSQGETPLIAAVHQRNIPLIRLLLANGGNPDRNDNSGRSARDYIDLMNQNTLLKMELEKADEERKGKGTSKQYGPSL